MGLLLNDVILLMKVRQSCPKNINIFTLGPPTSHVLNEDLKFLIKPEILEKLGIRANIIDDYYLKKLNKQPDKEKATFNFFTKLIKIKDYFSIDINKKSKPTYCIDITKKINKNLMNKADLIYDTGSLSYTGSHFNALNFLNKLLKKKGIILHQSTNNGSPVTGYCQINRSYFDFYYKKYEKILVCYGFCDNFLNYFRTNKKSSRIIHIDSDPKLVELMNKKNYLYYAVKKVEKNNSSNKKFYFYSDNKIFRKYFQSLLFISRFN